MKIASRLKRFLDGHGVPYDVIHHAHTASSAETARAARVPGDALAKSVLLEDGEGYLLAVLPSSRRIDWTRLQRLLKRRLELAPEQDLARLFDDCEAGAVPPLGPAYGVPAMVEDELLDIPDVYCEAGTHEDVLHLRGDDFLGLIDGARHGTFSR